MRDVNGQSIAYSTTGASSHINVLRFISEYGLKAKPVATGDVASTITQTMSGQVDVGWSVAPFALDAIARGEVRMIARASDLAAARAQTIRVQIVNAQNLAQKKDVVARYLEAYNETVGWMYSSPEAVPREYTRLLAKLGNGAFPAAALRGCDLERLCGKAAREGYCNERRCKDGRPDQARA